MKRRILRASLTGCLILGGLSACTPRSIPCQNCDLPATPVQLTASQIGPEREIWWSFLLAATPRHSSEDRQDKQPRHAKVADRLDRSLRDRFAGFLKWGQSVEATERYFTARNFTCGRGPDLLRCRYHRAGESQFTAQTPGLDQQGGPSIVTITTTLPIEQGQITRLSSLRVAITGQDCRVYLDKPGVRDCVPWQPMGNQP